jgi:menaquinone-dependent protoporphyrinogen oxidase
MTEKVLVAYSSKHGATGEIAEKVGEALRGQGLEVDVSPARSVRSVDPYRAVVVGSAVYMGRWRRDALRLLRRQKAALVERDVWLFGSGPVGDDDQREGEDADRWIRPPKVQRLADEIGAHAHAVFGGVVSEDEGGFMRRNMAKNMAPEVRDRRDWDEIETWAKGIVAALVADRS